MLLFHRAFCEYAFNDNFGFLLRNDPYFGSGTFGQLAGFMPERIYVMHKQLSELKDGGWMEKPEFSKYLRALKGIPERSESCADKGFFDKLPEKFFEEYKCTFKKHVSERRRSDELISYMLGGEPSLAKELAIAVL